MSSPHLAQGSPTSVIRAFFDESSSGGIVLMLPRLR